MVYFTIWVNFGEFCNGKYCYMLWPFGLFYIILVYIVYDRLVYLISFWYILWPFGLFDIILVYFMAVWSIMHHFGVFCGHLVYIPPFWYVVTSKIWQPWPIILAHMVLHPAIRS
jgi:hypothetical protein